MKKKIITIIVIIINIIMILSTILIIFLQKGIIILNKINTKDYEVKGIDVSNYQGEIDWNILSQQEIQFAFIKATEGENYVDAYFSKNYQEAKNTDLVLGAYHFFDWDADGEKQADHFINVVGELPEDEFFLPIVDVEFYDYQKPKSLAEIEKVRQNINDFLNKVENKYKIKPIIYTTQKAYQLYIAGNFQEYDLWIRNVWTKPKLQNEQWTFWQYTDKGKLQGYQGEETYIDLNVFKGTKQQFKGYVQQKKGERKNKIEEEKPQITSIGGIITKIEGNQFTVQVGENDIRELIISDTKKLYNQRTKEEILKSQVQEQDFIEIDKSIKIGETYHLLEESNVYITRNLEREALEEELLKQKEISMKLKEVVQNSNNNTIVLTGQMTDYYQQEESFTINVIVNKDTKVMSIGNKQDSLEILKEMKQRGDTLYITLQEEEKQKGKLVALNIEILGC